MKRIRLGAGDRGTGLDPRLSGLFGVAVGERGFGNGAGIGIGRCRVNRPDAAKNTGKNRTHTAHLIVLTGNGRKQQAVSTEFSFPRGASSVVMSSPVSRVSVNVNIRGNPVDSSRVSSYTPLLHPAAAPAITTTAPQVHSYNLLNARML